MTLVSRSDELPADSRRRRFGAQLREANASWFAERGLAVRPDLPYVLADREDWRQNIILPEVAKYIEAEKDRRRKRSQGFPLHKNIHSGLSSQAMLFNLVGPLIVHHDLAPLEKAFQSAGIPWPKGRVILAFEAEDRDMLGESPGQPTSIDLVIRGRDGRRPLVIEAKLAEREFGECSTRVKGECSGLNPTGDFDLCYLHRRGRCYWELLDKFGFLALDIWAGRFCPLAVHYQFFRELLFALELEGEYVLLCDERNPTFYPGTTPGKRGYIPLVNSFVPTDLRERIHKISIQEIVASFHEMGDIEWVAEFEKKYALRPATTD